MRHGANGQFYKVDLKSFDEQHYHHLGGRLQPIVDTIRRLCAMGFWHVTAFHKDYKMTDPDNTSPETLMRAAEIGKKAGLRYIYAGNLPGKVGDLENTRCPDCHELLIERFGYLITHYRLTPEGHCPRCSKLIPGCWDPAFGGQITSHPFVPRLRVSSNHRHRSGQDHF